MSIGDAGRQRDQYRKGVLLGLTVAEAMLLILFALLLALGAVLTKKDQNLATLAARLVEVTQQREIAQTRAEVLQAIAEERPTDEFIRELVLARELKARLEREEAALREREQTLRENSVLAEALEAVGNPRDRMRELAALGARLEAEIKKLSPDAATADHFELIPGAVALADAAEKASSDTAEATQMLTDAERVVRENATLRGQVARYREELTRMGRGGEYPPCWVTETGEIQYIFDIELLSSGTLRVRDVTPPARAIDRRELPVPSELFSGSIAPARFRALTAPLFQHSQQRECRFVVIARDRTSSSQKEMFKNLLLTVEGHFYKSLRR